MLFSVKLKGGALYVAIIISILISIVLSLFIVLAQYNTRSIQDQVSLQQLHYTLRGAYEISKSSYRAAGLNGQWQKMPYNNDSVKLVKNLWGAYYLLNAEAKNKHHRLQQTGLFGTLSTPDTALMVAELSRPIGLAGKIQMMAACYLPEAGVKSAYIEGTSFSDLNSVRPNIRKAPASIPQISEQYLKDLEQTQTQLNPYTDSVIGGLPAQLAHSFRHKTAVVEQGNTVLNNYSLSGNIKCISTGIITVENTCNLDHILLIARKVVFKKGFKGRVHVIASDSIVTEDECQFSYPSSFTVFNAHPQKTENQQVRGIFFGEKCRFDGSMMACEDKKQESRMVVRVNRNFMLIGNLYCSHYSDVQGNLYGTVICRTILLQTPSAVYENHILNCRLDPKSYGKQLAVPDWFSEKQKSYKCAQWF